MVAVLEITGQHGARQYHRIGGEPLTIGRAYDCDIILNDDYLSAHHLTIRLSEEGQFIVTDLGSENGTLAETGNGKHQPVNQESTFAFGTRLHIGKTILIPYSATTAVPPAKQLHHPGRGVRKFLSHYAWLLQFIALLVMSSLFFHLDNAKTDYSAELIGVVMAITLGIAVWAGCWAFLGRLLTHQSQFFKHVGIFSSILCLAILVDTIKNATIFSLESIDPSFLSPYKYTDFLEAAGYSILFLVLLSTHLEHATLLSTRKRWIVASILPLIGMVSALLINYLDEDGPTGHSTEGSLMLPPSMRISGIKSENDFINGLDSLERLAIDEAKKAKD